MAKKNIQLNEAALASAARDGDKDALLQLLQQNWTWLKGLLYNVLQNQDDVDETLQNICVLLIEKINGLREPERFKPWLATVARNTALAYRKQRSKKPIQLDELLAAHQRDPGQDIVEKLASDEQHEKIIQSINELPEKYREVFILKHLQDTSYAQIAELLEVPITTVQIRLVRSRRMMQNKITGIPNNKIPRT